MAGLDPANHSRASAKSASDPLRTLSKRSYSAASTLRGLVLMPWWLTLVLLVLWAWACFQTYRGVRFGKVRARMSDVTGRWNPLFWIYFAFYAFGAVYLPLMLVVMGARSDKLWP